MNYAQLPKMSDFRFHLRTGKVRRRDILRSHGEEFHALSDFPIWRQDLTGAERRTRFLYGSFALLEANCAFVGPRDQVWPKLSPLFLDSRRN
mmetsp:Transcript_11169/g.22256  ORF Transcript_11169/g.22256 Transcript_11169/m.22256 type:complete len:92 (-) Transcript_11169:398-673(-)